MLKPITLDSLRIARDRETNRKAIKLAKTEWRNEYEFSKRSYPWTTIFKIDADNIWKGKNCEQFSNRIIEF